MSLVVHEQEMVSRLVDGQTAVTIEDVAEALRSPECVGRFPVFVKGDGRLSVKVLWKGDRPFLQIEMF